MNDIVLIVSRSDKENWSVESVLDLVYGNLDDVIVHCLSNDKNKLGYFRKKVDQNFVSAIYSVYIDIDK